MARRNGSGQGRKQRRSLSQRLGAALKARGPHQFCPQRLLLAVLSVVGYTLLLSAGLYQPPITWEVGEIATRPIIADREIATEDRAATEELRKAAMEKVPKQYAPVLVGLEAENTVKHLFSDLTEIAADDTLPTLPTKMAEVRRRNPLPIRREQLEHVLSISREERDQLQTIGLNLLRRIYAQQFIHDDVPEELTQAGKFILTELTRPELDLPDRLFLTTVLTNDRVLRPNQVYQERQTLKARLEAAEQVEPVMKTVGRGDRVIGRGDRVTADHLQIFEGLGLLKPQWDFRALFSLGCLVCLTLVVLGAYVRREVPEVYYDVRRLFLLNLLVALAMLSFRSLMVLKGALPSMSHQGILCGATTGMVVAALVDYRAAMMLTGALAMFLGLLVPGAGLAVAFEAWLAGRVGAMALRSVQDRYDLARAGVLMAVSSMMIAVVLQLPRHGDQSAYGWEQLGTDLLFGFGWGLMSFLLGQGLVVLLERPFGVITPFRLLELTNTSTPALQELKRRARGSFDSSLTIGDMAADACEAIGANPLLARACGYHHDIGKMAHPEWFIENQFDSRNIHDRTSPTVSALAIKSHVEIGLQLAREYNLPRVISDVIAQHHGTTRISFFYYQALEQCREGETVDEGQFRYPGPKPQFKESGIIMLADGIEASVRAASMHGPLSQKKIEQIVQKLVATRRDAGELDECDLTMRDLTRASEAFCDFLKGMYHSRVDYPTGAKPAARPSARAGRTPQPVRGKPETKTHAKP